MQFQKKNIKIKHKRYINDYKCKKYDFQDKIEHLYVDF